MKLSKNDISDPAGNCPGKTKSLALPDMPQSVSTPCIKVCAVSGQSGLCIGCGRTLAEIAAWGRLSEDERKVIMADLPARLAAMETPAP